MKTIHKLIVVVAMIAGVLVTIVACSSTKKTVTDETTIAVAVVEDEFKLEKSGAQYWGETCNRCHLAPSPADYNDTDWETISLHMRVRANLTEKEITKIEEFLKSAN
jgi:cytochrome c5